MNSQLLAGPWAIEPIRFRTFVDRVTAAAAAAPMSMPGMRKDRDEEDEYAISNGVAVIPIHGIIIREVSQADKMEAEFFGMQLCSASDVARKVALAADDRRVDRIMLDISSPGGQVAGTQEAGNAIFAAREKKPVEACITDIGASGAYWLASQADHIAANETAEVGSIGVFVQIADLSEMAKNAGVKIHVVKYGDLKGMGIPGTEVTDAHLAECQKIVNGLGEIFLKTVARGRDCDDDEAMAWATGGVWLAKEAMAMGLIDGVATRDQMLACERAGNQPRGGMEGDMEGKQTGPSVEEKISAAKAEATAAERARLATFCEEFAGYRDFAVEQFAAGKSLDEARVAFVGVLKAELAAGKAELVKVSGEKASAEAKLAEALKASAAAAAVAEPAAAKPIENAGSPQGAASVDFVARARDLAKEKQISITAAMKQLAAAEPEAHKAYLAGQRPVKVRDGK